VFSQEIIFFVGGCQLAVGSLLVTCRSTVGNLLADSRPPVARQVFWGALLHNYPLAGVWLWLEIGNGCEVGSRLGIS